MIEVFAPGGPMADDLDNLISCLLIRPNNCLAIALSDDPCVPGAPCTRAEVVAELGDRLFGQMAFLEFEFGPEEERRDGLDLPAFLRRRLPAVEPTTVLAYGLSDLPPQERRRAVRALNLGREVLRDQGYSLVLWLTPETVPELTFHAPDFWAWKTLTVEFPLPLSKLLDAPSPLARLGLREADRLRHARRYYEESLATPAAPALTADLQLALSRTLEKLGQVEQARALRHTALETLTGLGELGQLRQTYDDWIIARYRWLDFRGLHQVRNIVRLPLDELFVPLWTMSEPAGEEGVRLSGRAAGLMGPEAAPRSERVELLRSERVELRRALAQRRQAVILGEPGSGKTTLLKYLALSLAQSHTEQTGLPPGDWLPLLVPISDFAAACRADPALTLEVYLPRYFAARGLPDLQALIAPALAQDRALLLLDGLDEVATPGERQEMAARVVAFVRDHPGVRLALTSRPAGYRRADLPLDDLAHFTILEFSDDDLATFVGQWCRAWEENDPERARRSDEQVTARAAEHQRALLQAITDTPHVRALAANPLLVTILALIHYQGARLPEQRAELYRLCVEALAETWNQVRSLSGRPIDLWLGDRRLDEGLVVRLLAPLAFWLHGQAREGGLIQREELIARLTEAILEREDVSDAKAGEVAADFVRLICQHSGLLVERGPGQFAFMHLTFQEYLAARHLARRRNREALAVERMGDPRWREVILLAAAVLEGDDRDDLVLALLHAGAEAADGETRGQGIELAGAALADLGRGQVSRRVWRQATEALAALVEETDPPRQAPVPLRVAAGLALGTLGDPRPGVCDLFPLLVEVPGGPFLMGSPPEEVQRWKDWTRKAIEDGRYTPPEGTSKDELFEVLTAWLDAEEGVHEIEVPAFYIARYPVTNAQFAPFVEGGGYDDPALWTEAGWAWRQGEGEGWGRPPERRGEPMFWHDPRFNRPNQPVVGVTWFEAMAYARWLTWRLEIGEWRLEVWRDGQLETWNLEPGTFVVRLPTEAEWEKAARGTDGRIWPWGDEWDETKANTAEGRGDWATTPVGLYPGGASPYGALDMVGNVWEWTSTRWGKDWRRPGYGPPYRPDDGREDPAGTVLRVLRGGSWNNNRNNARCGNRNRNNPDNWNNNVGLRVAVSHIISSLAGNAARQTTPRAAEAFKYGAVCSWPSGAVPGGQIQKGPAPCGRPDPIRFDAWRGATLKTRCEDFMSEARPLRSVLFVPGSSAKMLNKARDLPADALILDLEDGVAAGEKEAARETIRAALEAEPFAPFTIVRVNGLGTGLTGGDVQATLRAGVDAISVPKVESAAHVRQVDALVAQVERERGLPEGATKLVLFVETARGVLRAFDIATASRRVIALAFGAEDLCRDIGAVRTKEGAEIATARAQLVLAARAAGVLPIDTVYTAVRDTEGLAAEARLARQWGFAGKLAIHPAQIEPIHRAFTPSEEEVAYARRVVAAFEAAEAAGSGVVALDGQMIDAPVVARARDVLALAGH